MDRKDIGKNQRLGKTLTVIFILESPFGGITIKGHNCSSAQRILVIFDNFEKALAMGGKRVSFHCLTAGWSHLEGQMAVARKLQNRLRQSVQVTGWNNKASFAIFHYLTTVGSSDDRNAVGHRFQLRHAEAIRKRREDKNITMLI